MIGPVERLCLALGAIQFSVTGSFALRRWRQRRQGRDGYAPAVTVLVPACGGGPRLEANLASILDQAYDGRVEFLFIVADERDASFARIRTMLAGERGRTARLLTAGMEPTACSAKAVSLLRGLREVTPETEVLVFADADLRVRRDWLSCLIAPLADADVGASTAVMLYAPSGPGIWSFLRLVWLGAGIPYFELMGLVTGQSWAIRRTDFEALGAADIWSRSLYEDLALYGPLRRWGRRVVLRLAAAPVSNEDCSASEFFSTFGRWMRMFRVYAPTVWALGAFVTALKIGILLWALKPPVSWNPLGLLFGFDAVNLALVFMVLDRCVGDRFDGLSPGARPVALKAALAAPLLQAAYAANFASSLFNGLIPWGPYVYRLRGPQDVEVAGRR